MAKMRLEVVIETDGEHCGRSCPMGDEIRAGEQYCLGVVCEYDWQARKYKRNSYCAEKAALCKEI